MDHKKVIVNINKKTGRSRKIKEIPSLLCIGDLGLDAPVMERAAIKLTEEGISIDKNRCSKCYLCKLILDNVHLDEQHFPYISDKKDGKKYNLTIEDRIHFESCIARFKEEDGISKWIYLLCKILGIDDVYTEVAINKEEIPNEILKSLGKLRLEGQYSKSVIPDIEGKHEKFVFVFENKRSDIGKDDWITEALKQTISYAHSEIYKNKKENINFIFCYNGSMDIKEKIINISKNHKGINETKKIFKDKSNYYFSVLNSSQIYNLIAECLKNGNKDKQKFIGLIKEKRMILG